MSGAGTSSSQQQTQQTQNSTTAPWSAAQPALKSILSQLGQQPTTPSAGATNAANLLQTEAGQTPSYAPQGEAAVDNLFGSSTTPQQNQLNSGYANLQGQLSPYLQPGYLNPASNPYLSGAIGTMNEDVTNAVNGRFAASGRDLSPDNSKALARGLSQGESGILAGQYNTNVGQQQNAASTLYNAAGATATGTAGLQQIPLANQQQAIQTAGNIPGLLTQPGATQLSAATTAQGLPLGWLAQLEQLTNPIASLGSQSSGTGTSNTQGTQTASPIQDFTGIMGGLGSLFAPRVTASDARIKEDIKPIGELYDHTPVYSYKYIGDERPQIGLLAQDIEKIRPDAVVEVGGIKGVDYGLASERSRVIGMLDDLLEAA